MNELDQDRAIENRLIHDFKLLSTTTKKKLKIKGDIEACLKNSVGGINDFGDSFQKNFTWLPKQFREKTPCGMIISQKFTGFGIRINKHWYTFRAEIKPVEILGAWMSHKLAKHLIFKTLLAYVRIKVLTTRAEPERYNYSLRLVKQAQHE